MKVPKKLPLLSCLCLILTTFLSTNNSCLAQTGKKHTETITLTTYYPAPYGVYRDLQAHRLSIGDVNKDGTLNAQDFPIDPVNPFVESNIYLHLPPHSMAIAYVNLGEDEYRKPCDEKPKDLPERPWFYRDTCDGDTKLPYQCRPDESKTCRDVFKARLDLCTGEIIELSEKKIRNVKCRITAAWQEIPQ